MEIYQPWNCVTLNTPFMHFFFRIFIYKENISTKFSRKMQRCEKVGFVTKVAVNSKFLVQKLKEALFISYLCFISARLQFVVRRSYLRLSWIIISDGETAKKLRESKGNLGNYLHAPRTLTEKFVKRVFPFFLSCYSLTQKRDSPSQFTR